MVTGVADEALDLFLVLKADADPEAGLDGGVLMKVQGFMVGIAIEGADEEDGLGVRDGNIFHLTGVDHGEADAVERVLRIVGEKLLDRAEFIRAGIAANSVIDEADDNFIASRGDGSQD